MENTIKDPSKEGLQGLKGLKPLQADMESGAIPYIPTINSESDYRQVVSNELATSDIQQEIGYTGVGESMYDTDITSSTQLENLGDTRGKLQPWYHQVGAGLAKGAILAGTTFVSGTLGFVLGGAEAIDKGDASKLWDNAFARGLQGINEWSEEVMPNYYTDAEREEPWQNHIFSANFLGDKFIKNLGFTVGAFWSGNVASMGLGAMKIPQLIGKVLKSSKAPAIVSSGVGATLSAVNEGRIEALNNSDLWKDKELAPLEEAYNEKIELLEQYRGTDSYDIIKGNLDKEYQEMVANIEKERASMGNANLLFNLPILLSSNLIQFSRLYANGFKTARKAANITGKAGEYTASSSKAYALGQAIKAPLAEGTEELTQGMASNISGDYYSDRVINFNNAKINPEAEQQTVNWIKSMATGINETVNDNAAWEEFFIGALTGALGMPRFRSMKDANGNFQSPITSEEGMIGQYKDAKKKGERAKEMADNLNEMINSPESLERYQSLIRHNKFQNDMDQAVLNDDEFSFRTASNTQLVSDIAMFDNAGKLSDLIDFINEANDTSDENLNSIIENTTTKVTDANGKEKQVGPFIDKDGNPMNSTEEGKKQMIDKLNKNQADVLNTVNEYVKAKNDIDTSTGQALEDDQLTELTWLKVQREDWAKRAETLSEEIRPTIGNILGHMAQLSAYYQSIMNREGTKSTKDKDGKITHGLTPAYLEAERKLKNIKEKESVLSGIRSIDGKIASVIYATDDALVNNLKETVLSPFSPIQPMEAEDFVDKLEDIPKLVNSYQLFDEKLKEYLSNPGKLREDLDNQTEKTKKEVKEKTENDFKDSLAKAQNFQEFKEAMNNEEISSDISDKALNDLIKDGSTIAQDFKDIRDYSRGIRDYIGKDNLTETEKEEALDLFNNLEENAENLDGISDQDSEFLTDPSVTYDEKLTPEQNLEKFTKAQLAINDAMENLNKDKAFKDRVTRKPVTPKQPTPKQDENPSKDEVEINPITGEPFEQDNTEDTPDDSTVVELPIGDTKPEENDSENLETNDKSQGEDSLPTNEFGKYQHYAPTIPEFQIDATRQNDFRPFPEVVLEKQGKDFSVFYDYLKSQGAFDTINNGELSVGSTIGFMIDPTVNDNIIFLIDHKTNKIVGSLPEGSASVANYEGLKELQERVHKEFKNRKNKGKKRFVSSETTKVSKLMVGKVPYIKQERDLKDIPGVNKDITFAIVKNGVLTTNGKIEDNLIIKPSNLGDKEGNLYILLPNIRGNYVPSSVRVKHFNEKEFNPKDTKVQSSKAYQEIEAAIDTFSDAISEDDVTVARNLLANSLYIGNLHIDFVDNGSEKAIRFTKTQLDKYGREIYDGQGKSRKRREDVKTIHLNISESPGALMVLGEGDSSFRAPNVTKRDKNSIKEEIYNTLLSFNLPLQVNAGTINRGGANKAIIDSNILTSNMKEAKVLGNWFITDYFDSEGNQLKAVSPTYKEKPKGYESKTVNGSQVIVHSKNYFVDLVTNDVKGADGKTVKMSDRDKSIAVEQAWANSNFGSETDNEFMINNTILTPRGHVLDRSKGEYLNDKDSQLFKDMLAKKNSSLESLAGTVNKIYKDQNKVDKTKTDSNSYYILEEDGQYHAYDRVHSRLGENWISSNENLSMYDDIQANLSKTSSDIAKFNSYLKRLEKNHKVDLSDLRGKTDVKSREKIVQLIKDKRSNTNAQVSLDGGNAVDTIIRDFFYRGKTTKPDNLTEGAYIDLLASLKEVYDSIQARGERFLTNNIVLHHKFKDGTRIAGEVDILAVDKNGNFKIYDVKTSKHSFHDFINRHGQKKNYFVNKSDRQYISTKEYYTKQLSAYKNLFEAHYGAPITTLAILPFVMGYDSDGNATSITMEQGIPLTYDSSVNVPIEGNPNKPQTNTPVQPPKGTIAGIKKTPETSKKATSVTIKPETTSIENSKPKVSTDNTLFSTLLETDTSIPTNGESIDLKGKTGFYDLNGTINKGNLLYIGEFNGNPMHITMDKEYSQGFSKTGEKFVAKKKYYAVFPNGKAVLIIPSAPSTYTTKEATDTISNFLKKNIDRVTPISEEETKLTDFNPFNEVNRKDIAPLEEATPATINVADNGAQSTVAMEDAIKNVADGALDEFEDEFTLRQVDESDTSKGTMFDDRTELAWVKQILPQLTLEDRIRMTRGLIEVGNKGTKAWGAYRKGIITLSDVAAKGTLYHEAFHYVVDTMLNEREKLRLFREARIKYGRQTESELEELLAEDFREYAMTRNQEGLGQRILNFFKDLLVKITHWRATDMHMDKLFLDISNGKYARGGYRKNKVNSRSLSIPIPNLTNRTGYRKESKDRIYAYHGTGANSIKEFRNEFLLSGEGATAFTSGFYFTQGELESRMYRVRALTTQLRELKLKELANFIDLINTASAKITIRSEDGISTALNNKYLALMSYAKNNPNLVKELREGIRKVSEAQSNIVSRATRIREIKESKNVFQKLRNFFLGTHKLAISIKEDKNSILEGRLANIAKPVELLVTRMDKFAREAVKGQDTQVTQSIEGMDSLTAEAINLSNSLLNELKGGNRYRVSFSKDLNFLNLDTTDKTEYFEATEKVRKDLRDFILKHKDSKNTKQALENITTANYFYVGMEVKNTNGSVEDNLNLLEASEYGDKKRVIHAVRLLEHLVSVKLAIQRNMGSGAMNLVNAQKEVSKILQSVGYQGAIHKSGFSGEDHHILYNADDIKIERADMKLFNTEFTPSVYQKAEKDLRFFTLSKETRDALLQRGFNDEIWDKLSTKEQEQALKCS